MKVWVITEVYSGFLDDVTVYSNEKKATADFIEKQWVAMGETPQPEAPDEVDWHMHVYSSNDDLQLHVTEVEH